MLRNRKATRSRYSASRIAVRTPMARRDVSSMPRSTMPVMDESTRGAARFTAVRPSVERIATT